MTWKRAYMVIRSSGLGGPHRINAALFDMIKDSQSKHPADFQIEEMGDNRDGGDDEDEDEDDKDKGDEDEDDDGDDDNVEVTEGGRSFRPSKQLQPRASRVASRLPPPLGGV